MYRNRCFVFCFCFVCEITRESEKSNLIEACTNSASGDRNFVIVPIAHCFASFILRKYWYAPSPLIINSWLRSNETFSCNDIRVYRIFFDEDLTYILPLPPKQTKNLESGQHMRSSWMVRCDIIFWRNLNLLTTSSVHWLGVFIVQRLWAYNDLDRSMNWSVQRLWTFTIQLLERSTTLSDQRHWAFNDFERSTTLSAQWLSLFYSLLIKFKITNDWLNQGWNI